jgi:site-specific recombinase XerD
LSVLTDGSVTDIRLIGTARKRGEPEAGWVFPSSSREGHFNKDTAKDQHAKAIQRANCVARKNGTRELVSFQPYVLRHAALTQLAQAGCDAFTLARIAGHSSITITQRYIHPQADAIERAFAPLAAASVTSAETQKSEQVGTNLGTVSWGEPLG